MNSHFLTQVGCYICVQKIGCSEKYAVNQLLFPSFSHALEKKLLLPPTSNFLLLVFLNILLGVPRQLPVPDQVKYRVTYVSLKIFHSYWKSSNCKDQ